MNTVSKITIPAINILRRMRVQELKDLATKKGSVKFVSTARWKVIIFV